MRVRIATNSLASTNHAYVHGAYARYRKRLLSAGVEFLEARSDAARKIELHTHVMEDGIARMREVEGGIEILEGLVPGDWVATAGVHSLSEGQRVGILPDNGE